MSAFFLFGTLLDDDLREIVAGTPVPGRPARLPGARVERAEGGDWPILVQGEGEAQGLLVNLSPEAAARMDFYETAFAYTPETATVETPDGPVETLIYRAPSGRGSGAAWSLGGWAERLGPMTRRAAREAMALHGAVDTEALRFRMATIRSRAWSEMRAAANPAPAMIRTDTPRSAIEVSEHRQPYAHYFAVGQTVLRHPTFGGGMSRPMERAAFHMADAVTVLPFDPARNRVLLVEQFRYGPWLRGDPRPWMLEPVAGRIDPGETPETTARREALEEARLTLGALHHVGGYYPGPGAVTEFIDSYVGIADLPDGTETVAGLDVEDEDIRTHILTLPEALDLIPTGEAATGPLLLSLLWLDRAIRRGDL